MKWKVHSIWHTDDSYNVIITYKKFCSVIQDAKKMFQIRGICVKCLYSVKVSALELRERKNYFWFNFSEKASWSKILKAGYGLAKKDGRDGHSCALLLKEKCTDFPNNMRKCLSLVHKFISFSIHEKTNETLLCAICNHMGDSQFHPHSPSSTFLKHSFPFLKEPIQHHILCKDFSDSLRLNESPDLRVP